jgi:hypothetical protein
MVDPTAGDPGAGESDPPGDAQQFPNFIASSNIYELREGPPIQAYV